MRLDRSPPYERRRNPGAPNASTRNQATLRFLEQNLKARCIFSSLAFFAFAQVRGNIREGVPSSTGHSACDAGNLAQPFHVRFRRSCLFGEQSAETGSSSALIASRAAYCRSKSGFEVDWLCT